MSSSRSTPDEAKATRAFVDVVQSGVDDGTTPGAAALVLGTSTGNPGTASAPASPRAGSERRPTPPLPSTDVAAPLSGENGRRDVKRVVAYVGNLHREEGARFVDEDTVWDLASLTKMLSTTLLAARAVDEAKLALDEKPWPNWPGVSVEHVLRHESGLPAWRPLFEETRRRGVAGLPEGKRVVVDAARSVPLENAPGTKTVYSDIGMIALGSLIEDRLRAPLHEVFVDEAARRFGPTGLRFVKLDVDGFHPAVPNVAPTERCTWRRRAVQGQVHDENCFAMGGVAGHAGLFGTLRDVERAAEFFRGPMTSTLRSFAKTPEGDRRPIGFDRATPTGSTGGALSTSSFGHLAFTGCSLWIEPETQRAFVLLANRIHPTREGPERMLAFRKRFHVVAASL